MEPDQVRRIMGNCYKRTVRAIGGNDRGVNLPKEWRERHGVEKGDEIVLRRTDEGGLEILPPDR